MHLKSWKLLDKGSEFVLRLPAVPATATSEPGSKKVSEKVPRRSSRVLVVDDNEDSANGLARLLKLSGHTVRVAHSGSEAIASAREQGLEFVVLDIGLPGMDGYEVAAQLRREECCKDAVIIAVTGYGEEQVRGRPEVAYFNHHLVKPINIDTLLSFMSRPRADA